MEKQSVYESTDEIYETNQVYMQEINLILDPLSGELLVEGPDHIDQETLEKLQREFGSKAELGCAKPLEVYQISRNDRHAETKEAKVRIGGYYHNSLTEGPGRRSSVLFQFCPLACKGCWVPHLHSKEGGQLVSVAELADELMNSEFERDGVSILGGEPFAQPEGLHALIQELRKRGCQHIVCYTGYKLETLIRQAETEPVINKILDGVDLLIDGPYIEAEAMNAGPWTGSGNQRVIEMHRN